MKSELKWKIAVDLAMTVLLLCQMAFMLIGEISHEWRGAALFVLFALHHILNRRWYGGLFRGRYNAVRILQTAVDILVLCSMLGSMAGAVMLSREVFAFLPIRRGMGFARIIHMLAAYWGFIFMSAHVGLHWGMLMGAARRISGRTKPSPARAWALRGFAVLICGFGAFSFVKNNIADYLFLRSQFVFFDMGQSLALFFGEYLSMMGMWACIFYYLSRLLGAACRRGAER